MPSIKRSMSTVSDSSVSRPRRLRRTTRILPNRRKLSITRSISAPKTHVINRTVSITQQFNSTGLIPQVGLVPSQFFSIWFTNQSVFLWINATNYSTASVPGYTDLAALFDEVKIDAIQMSIISGCDPNVPGSSGATGSSVLVMANDYNDRNAPTAVADVQQYSDVRSIRLTNNFEYKEVIRPKMLTYSLDSSGAPIASTPTTGFFRSNLDIEHNGKKCAIVLPAPNIFYSVFTFKYKFICKTAK